MIKDPILIVDDDDNLRETMADALAALPVEITTAASAQKALDEIDKRAFAVVVTDLVMEGKDGFDVLQCAKRRHAAGRVIMLTGHGSREVAVDAMQKGATYYIEKPVDLQELRTKVGKCLELKEMTGAYSGSRSIERDRMRVASRAPNAWKTRKICNFGGWPSRQPH